MNGYAAVVLAAGQGSRFKASGGGDKVVAELDGLPLVRHVIGAALRSTAAPVVVVTGHAQAAVKDALARIPVLAVHNPDYARGLASSLRIGIAALPTGTEGAVVLLADMPLVDAALIDRLIAAAPRADAVVPVIGGRRGNPVLLSRSLFAAVARLDGDAGARHLLRDPGLVIHEIAIAGEAAAFDIDETADLERLQTVVASRAAGAA